MKLIWLFKDMQIRGIPKKEQDEAIREAEMMERKAKLYRKIVETVHACECEMYEARKGEIVEKAMGEEGN